MENKKTEDDEIIITDEDIEKVRNNEYVYKKVTNKEKMWEDIHKK